MSWAAIDALLSDELVRPDAALEAALAASAAAGLPPHQVTPSQGKLLELLARLARAERILEIGTLGGYSTLWLARALPPHGELVSLEVDPLAAAVARENIARAALPCRVEVRVGPALDTLPLLAGPFDVTFIDADKQHTPEYFVAALALSRKDSLIVVDNVVRGGAILEPADASARGIRRFFALAAAEPRVSATALQTVGEKGHDGFALALVLS
jgi:predicted O-methyltransferase YrrM